MSMAEDQDQTDKSMDLNYAICVLNEIIETDCEAKRKITNLKSQCHVYICKLLKEVLSYIQKYFPDGKDIGEYLDTNYSCRLTDIIEESLDNRWLKFYDTYHGEYILPKELFTTESKSRKKKILSEFLKSWRMYNLPDELENEQRFRDILQKDLDKSINRINSINKQISEIKKSNFETIDFKSIKFKERITE